MRVLLIIASGDIGGGTNHVLQGRRGLKEFCSFALETQRDSYLFQEASALGLQCFRLDFFSSRLDLRVPFGLRKLLASVEPTLVHVHGGRAGFFEAFVGGRFPRSTCSGVALSA